MQPYYTIPINCRSFRLAAEMKQQSLQLTESQLESDLQKVKAYLDRKQEHGNRQASLDVMSFDFSCHFEQPITPTVMMKCLCASS